MKKRKDKVEFFPAGPDKKEHSWRIRSGANGRIKYTPGETFKRRGSAWNNFQGLVILFNGNRSNLEIVDLYSLD